MSSSLMFRSAKFAQKNLANPRPASLRPAAGLKVKSRFCGAAFAGVQSSVNNTGISSTTTNMTSLQQRGLATHAQNDIFASVDASELAVPTIDITAFRKDPSSVESQKIVADVARACETTGFFQMVGHGISPNLQAETFAAAKRFFALPFDEKVKLDAKKTIGHRGYDVLASQSYEAGLKPDLKEGFYVGEHLPADHDKVVAKRFFMGPNVWPTTDLIAPELMQHPAEAYHAAMSELSYTVMRLIAAGLPYDTSIFEQFITNHPAAPLRFLHYPKRRPEDAADGRPQFGSSPHTDFGAITLLLQDKQPGLQIKDDKGRWIPVPPKSDAYVVNVGDMLSKWTGDRYKSSVHRVLNENDGDRYSIVFFLDGNLDCPLSPLDGSVRDGKVLTVEEHMLTRMAESYGTSKAKES